VGPAQTHKGKSKTTSAGSRVNGLANVFHNAAGSQVITRPIAKPLPTPLKLRQFPEKLSATKAGMPPDDEKAFIYRGFTAMAGRTTESDFFPLPAARHKFSRPGGTSFVLKKYKRKPRRCFQPWLNRALSNPTFCTTKQRIIRPVPTAF
jgi:hypothetical protein